jgi:hypothetical protein
MSVSYTKLKPYASGQVYFCFCWISASHTVGWKEFPFALWMSHNWICWSKLTVDRLPGGIHTNLLTYKHVGVTETLELKEWPDGWSLNSILSYRKKHGDRNVGEKCWQGEGGLGSPMHEGRKYRGLLAMQIQCLRWQLWEEPWPFVVKSLARCEIFGLTLWVDLLFPRCQKEDPRQLPSLWRYSLG